MRLSYSFVLAGAVATPAAAAGFDVNIVLPRLSVAEYHKPYVAVWLEQPGQATARTISVWYDVKKKNGEGKQWLRDVRGWWRKAGRTMTLPADGITCATRAPGPHTLSFSAGRAPLPALPAGNYELVVEAAREVGGRELVRVPFQWPPRAKGTFRAAGKTELGAVTVTVKP
jgi:hypothetical protein